MNFVIPPKINTDPQEDNLVSGNSNKVSSVQQLSNRNTQVVSASSASIRAILLQLTTIYMRTPAKLFTPARFDYLTAARILLQGELAAKPYNFLTHSSPALLYESIKRKGWNFIPTQILPPLIANSAVGVILYSTYLTSLQYFNGFDIERLNDPHPFDTFRAGLIAGAVSSFAASPLDALYSRSTYSELVNGSHDNLWQYAGKKLRQIGLGGIFAGFTLNFFKESLGFACYFSVFEMIKNQGYHATQSVIDSYQYWKARLIYRQYNPELVRHPKSERALQLSFILFAGASAASALIAIQYPINKIQKIHLARLESLDIFNEANQITTSKWFRLYYYSYQQTFDILVSKQLKSGLSWLNFMYHGFIRYTLTSIPATSIGLLVFEITRQNLTIDLKERLQRDLQP